MAGPGTIPPWDRLAQGPSHPPLSAIPQTKYMCREREAWPHHRWPAPGPSHLGTDLLKARPPPRGTVTSSLARPETIPPWDRLAQGPSRPPLSAIPQTKYMCREREASPQHRWPAPGPSHLGTDLLKARPPHTLVFGPHASSVGLHTSSQKLNSHRPSPARVPPFVCTRGAHALTAPL